MMHTTSVSVWSLVVLAVCGAGRGSAQRCERKPFRTTYPASTSSGRFKLEVPQVAGGRYLPDQQYLVTLKAIYPETHLFTATMVWPEGERYPDPRNPRRTVFKDSGSMHVHESQPVEISDHCPNTIQMINAAPTEYLEVRKCMRMYWKSPVRGNGCVTLHTMVAENEEVWYQDGDGLTVQICEDDSFLGDMPIINENCAICDEAKYELTFEGKWSRNTHPWKFPADDWSVGYGDLVGASHSRDYVMWKDGSSASDALKQLALFNATVDIEAEILENYAKGYIRTLIKGRGHGPLNGQMSDPTHALVRVDRKRHLISTATALRPSPDWFLGVSEYELCQLNNTWLPFKTLELIPWDAGVNKGISFESPYEPSDELVSRVRVGSFNPESPFYNMNYKQVKPFAVLNIRLIRTYPKICEDEEAADKEETEPEIKEAESEEPETPSRRTSPVPRREEVYNESEETNEPEKPNADGEECPLSEWDSWTACSSPCGVGYRSRSRYHVVNGVQYRYYKPDEKPPGRVLSPSEECSERHNNDLLMTEPCEGVCPSLPQENTVNTERTLLNS